MLGLVFGAHVGGSGVGEDAVGRHVVVRARGLRLLHRRSRGLGPHRRAGWAAGLTHRAPPEMAVWTLRADLKIVGFWKIIYSILQIVLTN